MVLGWYNVHTLKILGNAVWGGTMYILGNAGWYNVHTWYILSTYIVHT